MKTQQLLTSPIIIIQIIQRIIDYLLLAMKNCWIRPFQINCNWEWWKCSTFKSSPKDGIQRKAYSTNTHMCVSHVSIVCVYRICIAYVSHEVDSLLHSSQHFSTQRKRLVCLNCVIKQKETKLIVKRIFQLIVKCENKWMLNILSCEKKINRCNWLRKN